jgi:hypothetical protein
MKLITEMKKIFLHNMLAFLEEETIKAIRARGSI